MIAKTYLVLCVRWLATGAMSAGLLWAIVERVGPRFNEVVVRVAKVPATVVVDGRAYELSSGDDALVVLELRGGWHELTIRRDGAVTNQQRFQVVVGENVVLSEALPAAAQQAAADLVNPAAQWRAPTTRSAASASRRPRP